LRYKIYKIKKRLPARVSVNNNHSNIVQLPSGGTNRIRFKGLRVQSSFSAFQGTPSIIIRILFFTHLCIDFM